MLPARYEIRCEYTRIDSPGAFTPTEHVVSESGRLAMDAYIDSLDVLQLYHYLFYITIYTCFARVADFIPDHSFPSLDP
jgi:hypothetical protein